MEAKKVMFIKERRAGTFGGYEIQGFCYADDDNATVGWTINTINPSGEYSSYWVANSEFSAYTLRILTPGIEKNLIEIHAPVLVPEDEKRAALDAIEEWCNSSLPA